MHRILVMTVVLLSTALLRPGSARAAESDLPESLMYHANYRFGFTSGQGTPVCDSFFRRLKTTVFNRPPACGLPDTAEPGFKKLDRVELSTSEVTELYPRVWNFTNERPQSAAVSYLSSSYAVEAFGSRLLAWRYATQLSINNSKTRDNVIVWEGPGVYQKEQRGVCGELEMVATTTATVVSPRLAFVLTPDNKSIDEEQTRRIFGKKRVVNAFNPDDHIFLEVGQYLDFFQYRGDVYMHTFYDQAHGDIRGRRRYVPSLGNTLAVFVRRGGRTEQICEYQMSDTPIELPPGR